MKTAFDKVLSSRIRISRSVGSSKCSSRQVRRSARSPNVVGGLLAAPKTLWGCSIGEEKREHGDPDSSSAAPIVLVLCSHASQNTSASCSCARVHGEVTWWPLQLNKMVQLSPISDV